MAGYAKIVLARGGAPRANACVSGGGGGGGSASKFNALQDARIGFITRLTVTKNSIVKVSHNTKTPTVGVITTKKDVRVNLSVCLSVTTERLSKL